MSAVENAIRDSISLSAFPGASYGFGSTDQIKVGAMGRFTYSEKSQTVTPSTLYDLASLTKVIATTSSLMILHQKNQIDLRLKVADIIPEFGNNGKEKLTILHLLYHCSGLVPFIEYEQFCTDKLEVLNEIYREPRSGAVGEYVYSDLNFIVLTEIVERLTSTRFDCFCRDMIFQPLGMHSTRFCPSMDDKFLCAPTEIVFDWRLNWHKYRGDPLNSFSILDDLRGDVRYVQGEVHDERAVLLNGVAGHAGVFSKANDIALFSQEVLHSFFGHGAIFDEKTIRMFTDPNILPEIDRQPSHRRLGWHGKPTEGTHSGGDYLSTMAFGHLGFTGTSLWIDPQLGFFHFLLSNRVHPTRDNDRIYDARLSFAQAAYQDSLLL